MSIIVPAIDKARELVDLLLVGKKDEAALLAVLTLGGATQRTIRSLVLNDFIAAGRIVCPAKLRNVRDRLRSHATTNNLTLPALLEGIFASQAYQPSPHKPTYIFRGGSERWLQLHFRNAQLAIGREPAEVVTLRQLALAGRRGLEVHQDMRDGLIGACSIAAMLMARRVKGDPAAEDLIQDAVLGVVEAGSRRDGFDRQFDWGYGQLPNRVVDILQRRVAREKRHRISLIPHYKWIAASDEDESLPTPGLNEVHAIRLTRLAQRLAKSFRGRERSIVKGLYGLGTSKRVYTAWQLSRRYEVSVREISRIEAEASKRAHRLNSRTNVFLATVDDRSFKRSVAYRFRDDILYDFIDRNDRGFAKGLNAAVVRCY